MESQRTLLYITLAFLGFLLWQAWMQDHSPAPDVQPSADNTAIGQSAAAENDDLPAVQAPSAAEAGAIDTPNVKTSENVPTIHVVTDVLDMQISTQGGNLVDAKLPTYPVSLEHKDQPFQLLHAGADAYVAQSGLLGRGSESAAARAPTHKDSYLATKRSYSLADTGETLRVPLVWTSPDGVKVTKAYVFHPGKFYVDLEYTIENGSTEPWSASPYLQLRHGAEETQAGMFGARSYNGAAYFDGDSYHKLPFSKMEKEPLNLDVKGGWVAMLQHYFVSAWIPTTKTTDQLDENPKLLNSLQTKLYSKVIPNPVTPAYIIGMMMPQVSVAPGQTSVFANRVYVGPKLQKELAKLYPGLELTSDYGIFTIFAKPLFWLLDKIHAVVGNWGWAIILLTLLIKLAFFKLSATSYRSMAKMKKVAPKLQSIKERYPDDKQRQQQAMMELYKTEKINPLGGCLPILIQIPVFIALYWVLQESVELRQAPWILWIKDLSLPDPHFVLPLLMGASMFLQNKLNPQQPDPMMQKVMMTMPIVFTIFFAFFPSGLVLYWVVNNILSIAQQWYITRQIEQSSS